MRSDTGPSTVDADHVDAHAPEGLDDTASTRPRGTSSRRSRAARNRRLRAMWAEERRLREAAAASGDAVNATRTHYTVEGILREQVPVLAIAVGIGIIAGRILSVREAALLAVPILLVLVPPLNNAAGMIGSVFGARVSTGLHTGSLMANGGRQFRKDLIAALLIGVITFTGLALLSLGVATMFGHGDPPLLRGLLVVVGAVGVLLILSMVLTVILVGALSFHMGWDPDNVVIPVVTAAGDILAVLFLVLLVQWVGL